MEQFKRVAIQDQENYFLRPVGSESLEFPAEEGCGASVSMLSETFTKSGVI